MAEDPLHSVDKCHTCAFYKPRTQMGAHKGICRRRAPIPSISNQTENISWPTVEETDWCGEYERGSLQVDQP